MTTRTRWFPRRTEDRIHEAYLSALRLSYLSDFVTSGDDGYIGGDEYTHAYIFRWRTTKKEMFAHLVHLRMRRCIRRHTANPVYGCGGTARYCRRTKTGVRIIGNDRYYRVTITNAEGELLADFELTNGEPEERPCVCVELRIMGRDIYVPLCL
ncbi:MAG: hypothetical protein ACLRSW_06375 [Christensenellaceae bacterium]